MNYILAFQETGNNSWPLLIILGVFLVGMMAFSVLPQRKKQKQMAEMSSRIRVGDKIRTVGGIYGTIIGFDEDNNIFTILSGSSTFEIDRGCVYSMEMMGIKPTETVKEPEEVKEQEIEPVIEKPITEEKTSDDV